MAERGFKSVRLNRQNVDVTNIKTVHGAVNRLTGRLDSLEGLVREMHKEMMSSAAKAQLMQRQKSSACEVSSMIDESSVDLDGM